MKILSVTWNKNDADYDTGDNYLWHEESFFCICLENNSRGFVSKVRYNSIPYSVFTIAWFRLHFGKRGWWVYAESTAS